MRRAADAIAAGGEAMFPQNDLGAPTWREVDLVERTFGYLALLPPHSRRLVLLMLCVIELLAPILVGGFRRFSRYSAERRTRALVRWVNSRVYPIRVLGESFKAVLVMMWLSHTRATTYIGMLKTCERPGDPRIETRPDALRELAR
jgi:hypothetical protein